MLVRNRNSLATFSVVVTSFSSPAVLVVIQQHGWLSLLLVVLRCIAKNCLNARAKMKSDKFDDASLLARETK